MVQTTAEQNLILNLKAAGLDRTMVQEFLGCWKAGKTADQLRLLARKREGLLEPVHREKKQIRCLDYLVYHIEKSANG